MSIQLNKEDLKKIGLEFITAFGSMLAYQGRSKKSGGLINSLKQEQNPPDTISIFANYYWRFVDKGVSSASIKKPFAPPRINGLVRWLMKKGIGSGDKQIRSIAYAIAHTHGKKGMPTMGGRRDTKRLNFVDRAIKRNNSKINKTIDAILEKKVDSAFLTFKNA